MNKILILDLDSTLVYADSKTKRKGDFQVEDYQVFVRPHVYKFLGYCFKRYTIIIWSLGTKGYVHDILNQILTPKQKPLLVLTREDSHKIDRQYFKKTEILNEVLKNHSIDYYTSDITFIDDRPELIIADEHIKVLPIDAYERKKDRCLNEILVFNRYLEDYICF